MKITLEVPDKDVRDVQALLARLESNAGNTSLTLDGFIRLVMQSTAELTRRPTAGADLIAMLLREFGYG